MTENKVLKSLIRARMEITGETYTTARKSFTMGVASQNNPLLGSVLSPSETAWFASSTNAIHGSWHAQTGMHLFSGLRGHGKSTTMNSVIDSLAAFPENDVPTTVIGSQKDFSSNGRNRTFLEYEKMDYPGYVNEVSDFDKDQRKMGWLVDRAMHRRSYYIVAHEVPSAYQKLPQLNYEALSVAANSGFTVFAELHSRDEEKALSWLLLDSKLRLHDACHLPLSITHTNRIYVDGKSTYMHTSIPINPAGAQAAYKGRFNEWCALEGYESSSMKINRLVQQGILALNVENGSKTLHYVGEKNND
jgi:hypothetical protein